jgi:hypothetical protein
VTPETCVTCSDEAVAALVVGLDALDAEVEVGGRLERVALDLVPDAAVGERLLCHAGIALARAGARSGGGRGGGGGGRLRRPEADAGEGRAR